MSVVYAIGVYTILGIIEIKYSYPRRAGRARVLRIIPKFPSIRTNTIYPIDITNACLFSLKTSLYLFVLFDI
jgi:hypothetical protein